MAGVNKAIIVGNLGRDPELRYTQGGSPVGQLSVATTRAYNNKNDERIEETEWHRIVVWGKQAEHCKNYLAKGRQVYVEGRIQTRKYTDKDGVERYSTEIVADSVQFLGGRPEGQQGARGQGGGKSGGSSSKAGGPPDLPQDQNWNDNYVPSDPGDDDIPF